MRLSAAPMVLIAAGLSVVVAASQTPTAPNQPAPAAGQTDVYHVHFTKAAPGQAAALGKTLVVPDTTAPMPDHFVVFRHQEGDSWDYAVIQHLGQKAAVQGGPTPPAASLSAWHTDTFVSGPPWADFVREMGLGAQAGAGGMVYILGTHRAVPGHREQLMKALNQPAPASSKIQTGNVFLQHLEGGAWTFLTITRYNSWQDIGTDRAQAAADAGAGGWADIRQHSDFHRDTIADRIFPMK